MKSPNIDNLYFDIEKQLKLIEAYTEIYNLSFIFKACRLKPVDYINNKSSKIILYRNWFDEFGNSLILNKKKLKIIYNDLTINKENIICSDLYYGLSINKILKISKLIMINSCYDRYGNSIIISCLGIDNYLRTYLYSENEWKQISSLIIGINNLVLISKSFKIKNFFESIKKEDIGIPCDSIKSWITLLPINEEFNNIIKAECEEIITIFNKDN